MKNILAAALALLPLPALADWQYTRWGMTPDEVVAAAGGSAWLIKPKKSGAEEVIALGRHSAGDLDFNVTFRFLDGQLNSVALFYDNNGVGGRLFRRDGQNCNTVRRALESQYGSPDSVYPHDTWIGREVAPNISLIRTGTAVMCTVLYENERPVSNQDRARGNRL